MAKTKTIGKCRLCLTEGVELQDSHFLPAAIYRGMRDSSISNPNPFLITPTGAKQTSMQQKHPLLCRNCEQLFSAKGEQWTLSNYLRGDGTFRIAEVLKANTPLIGTLADKSRIYLTDRIAEIDQRALTYFASSMFWRGSIHPWKDDGTYPVKLGRRYEEEFRLFLLGQQGFPLEASLWVTVREGGNLLNLAFNPTGGRLKGPAGENLGFAYRFPIPGLTFTLTVGRGRLEVGKQFCIVRGEGNPIIVSSLSEEFIEKDAVEMARRAEEAKAARTRRTSGSGR